MLRAAALITLLYHLGPLQPASSETCVWGVGSAVPQPPPQAPSSSSSSPANLTCTPPSVVGGGSMSLDAETTVEVNRAYFDAQVFSYHQGQRTIPSGRTGEVKVALLPLEGGDGRTDFNVSLDYIDQAGKLGADLAVLPENFAQKHIGTTGDMNPSPQTMSGSIITAVAALAKKHRMNVVAPIREIRGREILNTAVVLNRSGAVIGRYSKIFPVLGPPDSLGPGSREAKVDPSQHGVVAVDMDFGRISLAICFDINFPVSEVCLPLPSSSLSQRRCSACCLPAFASGL
jgi:hypothetical protein